MKKILLIISVLSILISAVFFYIGIHDEIYEKIEKNKFWFSDGSYKIILFFILLSLISSIYIFYFIKKK